MVLSLWHPHGAGRWDSAQAVYSVSASQRELLLGAAGYCCERRYQTLFSYCRKSLLRTIIVLLVIAVLGPEKWAPRTELGWQFDHFIGYFVVTLFFCFAWPRSFVVGGVIKVTV